MVDDEPTSEQLTNRGFDEILNLEHQTIRARRRVTGISIAGDDQSGHPADLFGVALSGGGIRSASFSLGALQALNSWGLINRMDYLSTVSGGGYIGTSMIAAMNSQRDAAEQSECKFPFSRATQENVRDCEAVSHLRDFSRFLAPRGVKDITLSIAVILRGLAVNILLLLSFLLPLATVFVLTNPSAAALEHSILFDVANYALPDDWVEWSPPLKGIISDPFVFSKLGLVCLALWLTGWALWRSHLESFPRPGASLEHNSRGARIGRGLILFVVVALAMEVQPLVISVVTSDLDINDAGWFKWLTLTAGAIVSFIASFQAKLVVWIQHALNMPSVGARLRSLVAKVALYGAALTLPLMIYGVFLAIVVWGIRDDTYHPYTPGSLVPSSWLFSIFTGAFAVLFFVVDQSLSRDPMGRPWQAVRAIAKRQFNVYVVLLLAAWVLALPYLAVATRYQSIDSERDWIVLCNYLTLSAAVMIVASAFTENANGLHKLYRDRLRVAYRLWDSAGQPLPLHALPETAPYLLVNATLNVRVPRKDAGQATGNGQPSPAPDTARAPDPAKRGRNAEFFIFSKHAVGSESTRYADPESLWRIQPDLDLAAAAAISGAAVSSSMGRIGIGLLGPTLALLNLRLGFWLPNPSRPRSRDRHWEDIFRLYLFAEAFGRLRADSLRIYVTDGGHIDNIGLYQLLKRRCKFIIVIDGEADPAMNFSAFADVQRFARIDDGTLISLDWRPVRHAALQRLADRTKTKTSLTEAPRCAVGHILYENGEEGILLYVKAAVRGDEPDYVLDYERRYPTFPHEATSDQFFSEEQMEAYRALGFHSVYTALSAVLREEPSTARDRKSKQPKSYASLSREQLLAQMMERLGAINARLAESRNEPRRDRRRSELRSPPTPELTTDLSGIGIGDDNSARTSL
ncbi:patatin-like phospholipase family protein [Sinorhizobium meliloti]|uniref:patatin-like phospholipase family protein n=1 Tax=Rhizobium meliloti TaxID=382 RepID=UPI003F1635D8